MKQKAEEIYHRFVNYEWNDVSEGLKKSILEAIETALTEGQKLHIDDGVVNSENSVTVVYGKENICVGENSVIFAYGKGYTDINELQEDHSRIQENPLALLDVLEKNKMRIENIMNGDSKKTETEQCANPVVRRSFFGAKYLYLDDDTRVRYGFTLAHLGTVYTLQRKKGTFWKEVAWTYPASFIFQEIDSIIEFLKWQEEYKKRPKTKCLF